jgi:methionyl aminopeptidase
MNALTQWLAPRSRRFPRRLKRRRGMTIKSAPDVAAMREPNRIVATVLKEIGERAVPGATTADLDAYAEARIRGLGATPSFKGYYGFPGSACICRNHEVVHGIPSANAVLRRGDLLKVDVGAYKNGFHGDSCLTVAVGAVAPQDRQLMQAAESALYAGIGQVRAGNRLSDIAAAIEDCVAATPYSIVDCFTGHGVGERLHEAPAVFNVRTQQLPNVKLEPGMTLAIEPILNAGSQVTRTLADRWTVVTVDNALSAQYEHTVLVTGDGCEILTDRERV